MIITSGTIKITLSSSKVRWRLRKRRNFLNLRRVFVTGFERTKNEELLVLNDLQTESHLT